MAQLRRSGFVGEDSLDWQPMGGLMLCEGEIACLGEIVIAVHKVLKRVNHNEFQTSQYAYNAVLRGHDSFLRYDNGHPHHGHADAHHAHRFNPFERREMPGSPTWVGEGGWPTLGQFIEEVRDWYYDHQDRLPRPDDFAEIGIGHVPDRRLL